MTICNLAVSVLQRILGTPCVRPDIVPGAFWSLGLDFRRCFNRASFHPVDFVIACMLAAAPYVAKRNTSNNTVLANDNREDLSICFIMIGMIFHSTNHSTGIYELISFFVLFKTRFRFHLGASSHLVARVFPYVSF